MSRLSGKVAVIAGGTGTVGEAIVKVFLEEGATVIVPSRSAEAIHRLRDYLGNVPDDRLATFVGNVGDASDAKRLGAEIQQRYPALDAVVATLGGTWEERLKLVDVPMETWQSYWESNLTPHYLAAKTFLPLLRDRRGTSYTLLGGISAVLPIPQYSVVSINSAAQLMMARILMEESKGSATRINQVMFGYIHTRVRAPYAKPEWVTAEQVGSFCAYLASDEASMINGGVLQVGDLPTQAS